MITIETFSRRLCNLRHHAKMTQKEVAEICGVTPQAVSKWEHGLTCPDILILDDLCTALGTCPNFLFGDALGPEA